MAPRMKEKPAETDFPELTDEQLAAMRPAREVMPPQFFETVRRKQGQRGPGKKPAKVPVSIRLAPRIIEAFKAGGKHWQGAINEALLRVIKRGRLAVRRQGERKD
jgi:uncharacterized protein (DUF4415 family)